MAQTYPNFLSYYSSELMLRTLKSEEECLALVTKNGNSLKYLRESEITEAVAEAAIQNTHRCILLIPRHLRTEKICSIFLTGVSKTLSKDYQKYLKKINTAKAQNRRQILARTTLRKAWIFSRIHEIPKIKSFENFKRTETMWALDRIPPESQPQKLLFPILKQVLESFTRFECLNVSSRMIF